MPDHTVAAIDHLSAELNRANIKHTLKLPATVKDFSRSSTGVLYLARTDFDAATKIALATAQHFPAAFTEPITPFTKKLARGLSTADEPNLARAPKTRAVHSFGTFISDVIAEALFALPRDPVPSFEETLRHVEDHFRAYGVDPREPHLRSSTST
jgi:hypothetical protein